MSTFASPPTRGRDESVEEIVQCLPDVPSLCGWGGWSRDYLWVGRLVTRLVPPHADHVIYPRHPPTNHKRRCDATRPQFVNAHTGMQLFYWIRGGSTGGSRFRWRCSLDGSRMSRLMTPRGGIKIILHIYKVQGRARNLEGP